MEIIKKRFRWTQEADDIVCSFYLFHKKAKKADFEKLNQMMVAAGFKVSVKSTRARYLNYRYIETQRGLSNYSRQQKQTFDRLSGLV